MSGISLSRRHGFTVVELLIVIVVVGILATITIVSYNGVQDRARSIKIISQVKAYVDGLQLWEAQEGRPTTDSCIAPASAITGGICPSAFGWGPDKPWDSTFNQKLNSYAGISMMELGPFGPDVPKGLMWYVSNYYADGRGILYYTVGPLNDCELANVLSPTPGYDNLTLANANFTERNSTRTTCMIEVFKY